MQRTPINITDSRPLIDYFYHWEKHTPDALFLRQPFGDDYLDFTWKEGGKQARSLAAYLRSLQLPPHSHIGLVSKNCAEWFIADMAIMMAGHVSVPFFPTLTADQLNLVLEHSDCNVLIVGKLDNWMSMKPGVPKSMLCISFPTYNPDPAHVQWNTILEQYAPITDSPSPSPEDLMTIIYTSGTTGNPKGVMLTFRCFSAMLNDIQPFLKTGMETMRFFSYLPLCHIAERAYLENGGIAVGTTFYFSESLDSFAKNLSDARPTHIGSVPRIWVKFQQGILAKMPQPKLSMLLKIPIINHIVCRKIRQTLGLNDAVVILVGAAPMPVSITQWFRRLGIHIQEVYGMTENTGAVSAMPREQIIDGTVGRVHAGGRVKIDPVTGEICHQSPYNMIGYYKEPAMTAETIDAEGWLHTGDVGLLAANNFLTITGRVKEMYKTSKGEYIAPAQIEMKFAENPFIEQVCVVGQSIPQPMALIVLTEAAKAMDKNEVMKSLSATLNQVNPILKSYERIHKIIIISEMWTIENNKMTPTLKLKRNIIEKEFGPFLEGWYAEKEQLIM
jgi:long-chain acyl-CoA synthetase